MAWRRQEGRHRGSVPAGVWQPFHTCLSQPESRAPQGWGQVLPSPVLLCKMAVAVETTCQLVSYVLLRPAAHDMSQSEQSVIWQHSSPGDTCCE